MPATPSSAKSTDRRLSSGEADQSSFSLGQIAGNWGRVRMLKKGLRILASGGPEVGPDAVSLSAAMHSGDQQVTRRDYPGKPDRIPVV